VACGKDKRRRVDDVILPHTHALGFRHTVCKASLLAWPMQEGVQGLSSCKAESWLQPHGEQSPCSSPLREPCALAQGRCRGNVPTRVTLRREEGAQVVPLRSDGRGASQML
jgi:hypothetical protein